MPHATADEAMSGVDEEAAISQYLRDHDGGVDVGDREFDQTEKADDAIDFEDFSDDELPEEEEAKGDQQNGEDEDMESNLFQQLGGFNNAQSDQHAANGFHDTSEPDLFGEVEEGNDLFGEQMSSSPEAERNPQSQRPGGLALPSKSALALPTHGGAYQPMRSSSQPSPSSMSPPPFADRGYAALSPTSMTSEDEDEELDPQVALQRRLFKASKLRTAGDEGDESSGEADMVTFYQLYPDYEKSQAPRFVELFPPRAVEFKGKAPLKPPKVVIPTKLSLDLLHDQERGFKTVVQSNKSKQESTFNNSFVPVLVDHASDNDSDEDVAFHELDSAERVGNMTIYDLALICNDWEIPSLHSDSEQSGDQGELDSAQDDWDAEDRSRPFKKRRLDDAQFGGLNPLRELNYSLEDPERATAKLARSVALDLNDPNLLIDEHAPQTKRKLKRMVGDSKRDSALNRDLARRYNISNDQAYDLLKENHQHKVRSTLGSMAVEHSYPAAKLQYPFYKVSLDPKAKRAFHRPYLDFKAQAGKEFRFDKPKYIKKKHVRGREAKEVFAKAEDLTLGDSASMLLLEYSEEAPMMLSNFGMGNRLINYYRKQHADDQERGEKKEIGEAQVLLTQDKSPFANFGHVDKGETVPTLQNGMYRAPVFNHIPKHTDFVIGISSTYERGDRLYLRNVENLYTVGQQFPLAEVPGQHSRKVTDAAKKRLRALSYRIYTKSLTRRDKVLDNASLMPHLPGHDMPQTRSKMREFMKYERVTSRGDGSTGVWVPQPGAPVPDAETLRGWIRPEDVCLLDSMQVGVQHLTDLGISDAKELDEDKDIEEGANIELQLAPWRASKNFLNACQGKAMLKLHGEGDPTGQGLAFSFVKTSMKGGFQAQGESVEDKIDKAKRKETGGHSYNVAKQQKQYDESIRRIWEAQRQSLQKPEEISEDDMEDEPDRSAEYNTGRVHTPRSSVSTPAPFASRQDDDYMSQFSGHSAGRGDKTLVITRSQGFDLSGQPLPDITETVTNPAVIREYRKRMLQREYANTDINTYVPTGDSEKDDFARQQLQKELARIQRNADRREARERYKANKQGTAGSPSAAASPGPDGDGTAPSAPSGASEGTAPKGKGRSKDGTARKCANCGQVGHIKTNRKSVSTFSCPFCHIRNKIGADGNGVHGRKRSNAAAKANGGAAVSLPSSSLPAFVL
ncbi:Putative transcription initiation factor TFIID subunit 1 [Septoria linicola]|uniref:Transcription initiation factor TFIID subunit 1 n=1 Tax=Septoria linicola TaxID=215465 RepID=A0A9Q9EFC3_9PEZI|nr:putative transcription initiation factor TFIID subunit 1 [Septoria linicola]USW47507.1 Putative transcription initiation factor TFIID subunit 1 [Septoria linicola]